MNPIKTHASSSDGKTATKPVEIRLAPTILYVVTFSVYYFPETLANTHMHSHTIAHSHGLCLLLLLLLCRYGTGPHTAAAAGTAANKYVVWLCTHTLCVRHSIFAFPSHTRSLTVVRSFVRIKLQSSFSTGIFPWFLTHCNSVETCARSSRKSVFYFVVFQFLILYQNQISSSTNNREKTKKPTIVQK